MSEETPTPGSPADPAATWVSPDESAPESAELEPVVQAARPQGAPISLPSPTALPGLILAGLGFVVGVSGLMPWFTITSVDVNGFRGATGDSGWILGIPVGWVLLLAGGLLVAVGILLALTSKEQYRRPAALVALIVPTLTAIGIVAERFAMHGKFDDEMSQTYDEFAEAFKLGDGIGIWLGLVAALAAAAVAVWALVILSAQDDRPSPPAS